MPKRTADPLEWGQGPQSFEMFLEPTCPFSVKALRKLDDFLDVAGRDRVTVRLRMHSQPWHMFSPVVTRCVLAASMLERGRDTARRVLEAVADHREDFEFEEHRRGPNMDATPNQIVARLEDLSGVPLAQAFAFPEVEAEIKWHAKYARQNGIHASPTFMVNGLVTGLGSGDAVTDWAKALG